MKRSHIVLLLAGGTTLAGLYAFDENRNCRPDAMGESSTYCSNSSSSSSSHGGYGSGGGSSSSSHGSVAHGGFGAAGAAHGGGS